MVSKAGNTLPTAFQLTLGKHSKRPAMAIIGGEQLTYGDLNRRIRAIVAFLEKLGIRPGDKVAILSAGLPNWGASYYAVTFMGAVSVPLLPDFHPDEIKNILEHAEVKAIFFSENQQSKVNSIPAEIASKRIKIEDFSLKVPEPGDPVFDPAAEPEMEYSVKEDDLASIIYTSGTTGKSKGVMLSHMNICFTADKSGRVQEINETDRFLSVLPLSHTYENTIGMVLPMLRGAGIWYLGKLPTPSVLMPALLEVKPTIMLTVPMIIEKIFRNRIEPAFKKNFLLHTAIHVPFLRKKLNLAAGKKLMQTFGGELRFFGVGGAKLNKTVEKFLIEARFPYAIGYGLTETSPLLAGFNPQNARLQSTGPAIEEIELIIQHPDKKTGEGEIWAKGPNVMKGYYKEPGLTAEVITADGWFKTGDLGIFDKDGYLYIKGRLKNTIIGQGGENIHPEDIESIINNFRHVVDSLVVIQQERLVALVHFNREEIEERYSQLKYDISNYVEHKIDELQLELLQYVNTRVNKFSQVQRIVVQEFPFEKTPTQKIKRYLYT
ncbi:MAG: AMP-binding protein [Bacteroidetes bacterium]|nr:AMP-binding protein [Bacteroidota bacterium]